MEYTYIRDIDNIIEDKTKLKEVLLFLLQTSSNRYDQYDAEKLFDEFCKQPLHCFMDIIEHMSYYKHQFSRFNQYLEKFHYMNKLDIKEKVFFLLDYNFTIVYDRNENITFEEYLLRANYCDSNFRNSNFEFLEALMEYCKKHKKFKKLEEIIENSIVFKPDNTNDYIYCILNLKYICNYLNHIATKKFSTFCRKMIKQYYIIKGFDKKRIKKYNYLFKNAVSKTHL